MRLHEIENQLILYTKNHFKRIKYEEDLKYFTATLYGLGVEQVSTYNTVCMVISLYQNLVDLGYIKFKLETFLSETFRRAWREERKNDVSLEIVIKEMLAEIQGMPVKDLDLGEPDLSLLPTGNELKF